jgi:hypothetical protein
MTDQIPTPRTDALPDRPLAGSYLDVKALARQLEREIAVLEDFLDMKCKVLTAHDAIRVREELDAIRRAYEEKK